MTQRTITSRLLALVPALLCACASANHPNGPDAATAHDPRRDTDLARKETAAAEQSIDQGQWPEAESMLHKALDADVMYGPAHNDLGAVYLHEKNLYQAAWEFQYATKLMPYLPQPKSNLGLVFEAAGKLDNAVDWYDQAVKIEPDNPQFIGNDARARIRRGDRDAEVRDLLVKLVSDDTRPDWVRWAQERLMLMGSVPATEPDTRP